MYKRKAIFCSVYYLELTYIYFYSFQNITFVIVYVRKQITLSYITNKQFKSFYLIIFEWILRMWDTRLFSFNLNIINCFISRSRIMTRPFFLFQIRFSILNSILCRFYWKLIICFYTNRFYRKCKICILRLVFMR